MTSYKFWPQIFLVALSIASYVTGSELVVTKCKQKDDACILSAAQSVYLQLMGNGLPSASIPPSDPMHIDIIDGNLAILKYTLTDTTLKGFMDCKIVKYTLDLDKWTSVMEMICPLFFISGQYTISGRLIVLPVEGNGPYSIVSKDYKLVIESELKKTSGKDGKEHLAIKNFKVTAESRGGLVFDFKNLFNGNKELSDAVHKFANGNWKQVSEFVQAPVFNAAFKILVGYFNKYLKTIPFEDLFLQ